MAATKLLVTPIYNDPNLVSYWDFDASSSVDNKGSNNGTDTSITYSSGNGKFGVGAGFNGTSSIILMGTGSNLNITGDLSWSCWVKINGNPSGGKCIIQKGNDGENASGYSALLYVLSGGTGRFQVADGTTNGTNEHSVDTTGTITDNNWHNIIGTYDHTAGAIKIYLDGTLQNTTTGIGSALNSEASAQFTLGAVNGTTPRYYTGDVDEVAVFNRVLNQNDVNLINQGPLLMLGGL